jgi:hypothetical protein
MMRSLVEIDSFHSLLPHLYWAGLVFLITSIASLALVGILLVRLPTDYFSEALERRPREVDRRPSSWPVRLLKNFIGGVLIILGGVMALPGVPGPGALILLLGLMLADFRRKRQFEVWLVRRPGILLSINTLRNCFRKSPMLLTSEKGHFPHLDPAISDTRE